MMYWFIFPAVPIHHESGSSQGSGGSLTNTSAHNKSTTGKDNVPSSTHGQHTKTASEDSGVGGSSSVAGVHSSSSSSSTTGIIGSSTSSSSSSRPTPGSIVRVPETHGSGTGVGRHSRSASSNGNGGSVVTGTGTVGSTASTFSWGSSWNNGYPSHSRTSSVDVRSVQ